MKKKEEIVGDGGGNASQIHPETKMHGSLYVYTNIKVHDYAHIIKKFGFTCVPSRKLLFIYVPFRPLSVRT